MPATLHTAKKSYAVYLISEKLDSVSPSKMANAVKVHKTANTHMDKLNSENLFLITSHPKDKLILPDMPKNKGNLEIDLGLAENKDLLTQDIKTEDLTESIEVTMTQGIITEKTTDNIIGNTDSIENIEAIDTAITMIAGMTAVIAIAKVNTTTEAMKFVLKACPLLALCRA